MKLAIVLDYLILNKLIELEGKIFFLNALSSPVASRLVIINVKYFVLV